MAGEGNRIIPIPLPLRGLNTVEGLTITLDSGYAREFTNYALFNGYVTVRPAVRNIVRNADYVSRPIKWFDASDASNIYAILSNGDIRNVSASTGAASIGGTPHSPVTKATHLSTEYIFGAREPRSASNPFTAWTFTTLGITATAITAGCSHKGRLYVTNGTTIEYSTVGATTGTMAGTYAISEQMAGQTVYRLFSFSVSSADDSQNLLLVFGSGGRVLAFAGDYPGSASWDLIGLWEMSAPLILGFVETDGDIWVTAQRYAYWASELFSGGATVAKKNSPSRPIEDIWRGVTWRNFTEEISHAFYDSRLDAIVVQCSELSTEYALLSDYGDYINSGCYFVYFRRYNAWAVWLATPFYGPARYPYAVGENTEITKLDYTSLVDQYNTGSAVGDIDIETSWKTPYILQNPGRLLKVNGIRVNFKNSVSGYLEKLRIIYDRTDYNTGLGWYTQSMVTQVDPGNYRDSSCDLSALDWDQYRPRLGGGGMGESFSIQFTQKRKSGSSATQTQSLYGATCYVEDGGELI